MQGNQGSPRLKDSLSRRLSEQQQAVLYSNYSLLLLAAGRVDAARDVVTTYEKRCTPALLCISCLVTYCTNARLQEVLIFYRRPENRRNFDLLCRYPDSEELQMAAAAVLAREAKQQEALALVAKARSRNGALLRAQLALEAGDTSQVSHAVTGVL